MNKDHCKVNSSVSGVVQGKFYVRNFDRVGQLVAT